MFSRIELTGYRGFESYRLENLRRVNLLVGKNNSGKTSVIEAVHLLATNGDPAVFSDIENMRSARQSELRHARGLVAANISPFFFGYRAIPDKSFSLSSDLESLHLEIISLSEEDRIRRVSGIFNADDVDFHDMPLSGLAITGDRLLHDTRIFPVTEGGLLLRSGWYSSGISVPYLRRGCRVITAESLRPNEMQRMWDEAVLGNWEARVIRALQPLQSDIENLHFLSAGSMGPEVLVTVTDNDRRLPLASFGDGMRRFLALALSLNNMHRINAPVDENNVLLIDEIDTGLHWTVMEDLWRLVLNAARDGNVQVFATTHSYDCIKGLASLLENEPGLAEEVSLQKLERRLDKAVAFRGEQIPIAVDHNIELR